MEKPSLITIGRLKIALLTDGHWLNDGGCMFGVVPRVLWELQHPADSRNRIRLGLTCPLIMDDHNAVLVDTGIGNRLGLEERAAFGSDGGCLLEGLTALGMDRSDVTHVILSHLHFDHCGGIVRLTDSGRFEPAFPRARLIIQQGELEVAQNSTNERIRAAYRHVSECLEPVRPTIEAVTGDVEVIAGVMTSVTGGHTGGHQVVRVGDGAEAFAHLADIVPTRSHLKPAWNQAYDLDALRTMEQKARWLEQAAAGRWWISFAHDDLMLAARVHKRAGRFETDEQVAMTTKVGSAAC